MKKMYKRKLYSILKFIIYPFSLAASASSTLILIFATLDRVIYLHDLSTPASKGIDDLGSGLVIMLYLSIAALSSIPLFFILNNIIQKATLMLLGIFYN